MSKIKYLFFVSLFLVQAAFAANCPPTVTGIVPNTYPAYFTGPNPQVVINGSGFNQEPVKLSIEGFAVDIPIYPMAPPGITVNPAGTQITIAAGTLPEFTQVPGVFTFLISTACGKASGNFTFTGDWKVYIPDPTGQIISTYYADIINYVPPGPLPTKEIDVKPSTNCIQVVFTPDGQTAYCLNLGDETQPNGLSTLSIINVTNDKVDNTIELINSDFQNVKANNIAISPDGSTLLISYSDISSSGKDNQPGIIQLDISGSYNRVNPKVVATYFTYLYNPPQPFAYKPSAIAFNPDGKTAYAVCTNSLSQSPNSIAVIDPINKTLEGFYTNFAANQNPIWIGPLPTSITSSTFNQLVLNQLFSGKSAPSQYQFYAGITPTSPPGPYVSNEVMGSLSAPVNHIIASPDSKNAYFTYFKGILPHVTSYVGIINASTGVQTGSILAPSGYTLFGLAISPKGDRGIATLDNLNNPGSAISSFALTDGATASIIPINSYLAYPAITPDQAPLAVASVVSINGQTVQFSGTGSISPTGTIATYAWDFGPGESKITTTSPTITYTFNSPGTKTVTLIVTNTQGTSTVSSTRYFGQMNYNNGGPTAQTTLSVTVTSSCIPPPARVRVIRGFRGCYYRNVLFITPSSTLPVPTSFLIYADPHKNELLQTVPANGLNTVKSTPIKTRPPNECFYVFSESNGLVSCDYTKVCN